MQNIIILNKKEGETPLQALEKFRARHKKFKDSKMTYAGRLDPMATGVIIVLANEEIKNKEKYIELDKEYDFEILFGFGTDTYDILGKVANSRNVISKKDDLEKLVKKEIKNFKGKFYQKYPIYSSKTVNGKQLFSYARDGEKVEIPERKIFVKSLNLNKIRKISGNKLKENIIKRIGKVNGDFRQKEIVKVWEKRIDDSEKYFIASFNIKCGSGTYVRGIANSLGENINIPALAFKIKRTKVGKFTIE